MGSRRRPDGAARAAAAGSLGLLGLGLPQLLRAREAAAPRRGRARACILLFMWAGPAVLGSFLVGPQRDVVDSAEVPYRLLRAEPGSQFLLDVAFQRLPVHPAPFQGHQ